MRETKLYSTLVQLDGFELNRLHRFILSPYFNQSEAITRLYEWIKNDLKQPTSPESNKETVWRTVFGKEEPYNDGRFRKLQSDLLRLIEDYYAQEIFEKNPMHKAKYLLEAINNRRLDSLQSTALKTAQSLIQNQNLRPASFYYYQYEIEQSTFDLSKQKSERSEKSNIEEIALNLDKFYLAEKLRYYCTILNHQSLSSANYKMLFMDEIISHVEQEHYLDVPSIRIYYQIFLVYKNPEDRTYYDDLRVLIRKHIHLFPEDQVKEILDAGFNYCIQRSNTGQLEFVRELFELYVESLENKLIFVNNQITPWSFKNIVTAGLRLSEFTWVEKFINDYSVFLDPAHKDNAVTFNYAQLYFYKKDYPKVIELLSKVEYDDMTYNLNSKTLLMASYYELDEIEALSSLLDTFRVYLNRNKELPSTRRKHYLNTLSIVRKLSKIQMGDGKEISKLMKEIESTQGVVSKNWIMEKLDALKA